MCFNFSLTPIPLSEGAGVGYWRYLMGLDKILLLLA